MSRRIHVAVAVKLDITTPASDDKLLRGLFVVAENIGSSQNEEGRRETVDVTVGD